MLSFQGEDGYNTKMVDANTDLINDVLEKIAGEASLEQVMASSQPQIREGSSDVDMGETQPERDDDDLGFGDSRASKDGTAAARTRRAFHIGSEDEDEADNGDPHCVVLAPLEIGDSPAEEISVPASKQVGVREARRQIRGEMKADPYAAIMKMRRKPHKHSMLRIPLCRLLPCDFVRPAMMSDVQRLQGEFYNGIRPGSGAFYVAETSHEGETSYVTKEVKADWCPVWLELDKQFETELKMHADTKDLSRKMFYVFDGNHRTRAWREFIEQEYPEDVNWASANGRPDCIVLDVKGSREALVTAMHAINK